MATSLGKGDLGGAPTASLHLPKVTTLVTAELSVYSRFPRSFFPITVYIPIWFCISVRCIAQWLDIMYYTKCSPDISSIHLAPYIVITMLLTIFPTLYLITL